MLSKTPPAELQDTIDGRALSYRLRRATPQQRATLAKGLVSGEKPVRRFTLKQASAVCKVSLPLINQAVNGKKKIELQDCVAWWQQASFSQRVDFVRACGVAETWDAVSTAVA